ncbi:hypothetical protein NUW58_g10282 [Xylaria curta]|uniref:Uncharacterized protein n=1 Tax=Xylaria curta TaxID=42375 RepID=A0ACC1MNP7_9PEZI|nr:hypothetical protein NUW58_g10282 [Xylaria curta]
MSDDDDDATRDSAPDLQILGDHITLQPRSYTETRRPGDHDEEALMRNMARFRSEPLRFLREVSLHVSGTGWRAYDNFILHYIADLDIPVKRGTFVEFRNGMINVSPIGRNANLQERLAFEKYDLEHGIRPAFIEKLKERFTNLELTYSIGGQLSFDIFPTGWDKTYCLRHLEDESKKPSGIEYKTVHFFGDKTFKGGNDWEIYTDPRVTGHSVKDPDDTRRILKELFDV